MEDIVKQLKKDVKQLIDNVKQLSDNVKKLDDALKTHIYEYENYHKHESNAQEEEITEKLIEHLSKNNVLRKVRDKTHYRISKNLVDCEGNIITELDGLIIFKDNDQKVKNINIKQLQKDYPGIKDFSSVKDFVEKVKNNKDNDNIRIKFEPEIMLIEAKHHVTVQKLNEKYNQVNLIKDILRDLDDDYKLYECDKKYTKMVESFKKAGINNNTKINVYIGGLWWDDLAIQKCKTYGFNRIILSGDRYKIIDKYSQMKYMVGGGVCKDKYINWKKR